MKIKYFGRAFGTVLLLFIIALSPKNAAATAITYEVNPADSSCNATTSIPPCFTTISAAIQAAENAIISNPTGTNTYSIRVEPGNYSGGITLGNGIDLIGRDSTRTILNGASGVIITASSIAKDTNIRNFTFINASVGVLVQSSAGHVNVVNNIFHNNTTAVQVQSSPLSQIVNNTFYLNTTAVIRDSDSISIVNNIFSNNVTGISQGSVATQNNISFNDFFSNSTDGPIGSNSITTAVGNPNPLFVNANQGDFHLQQGSLCINSGTNFFGSGNSFDAKTSDIGAYGGPNSDTIPFMISGITFAPPAGDSVNVSWSPNNSYIVTNTSSALQGGYNVYYNFNKSGPPYDNKVTIPSTDTSTLISGLITTVPPPSAPVLNEPGFENETLLLSWSLVPTAASYFVHYTDTDLATSATNTIGVGNTTAFALTGLINGHHYAVTVSAVAQAEYHFSVTAFDYTVVSSNDGTPGVDHESAYLNPDKSFLVGAPSKGPLSNTVTAFPEAISPYPGLPNKGCFIATAAYGYYSAPQVQALREFRDRYLMTNGAGRAFVGWYYHYGPIGAEFINAHAWLKPVVRTALMPAVGGALFMTRTALLTKLIVLILAGLPVGYFLLLYRRKFVHSGGER